jgi:ABC-2 type transport system ATP-binding protein
MTDAAIRIEGLGRRFGDLWAVRGVNLELRQGEVFGLLGPNGAGKTTTVRMLTSLIGPSEGHAWIDGLEVTADADAVRARIGILTETPGLYDRLTATQNLDYFAQLHQLAPSVRAERIEHFMRLFELWDRRHDLAGAFSKGMKQKLAIARALIHEPSVVFLDEPTAALDPEAAFVVREAIASLRGAGRTIVLCTHNLDEAERLCDRIGFMRGELLRVGSPSELRGGNGSNGTGGGHGGGWTLRVRLVDDPGADVLAAVGALAGISEVAALDGRAAGGETGLSCRLADLRRDAPEVVRAVVGVGGRVLGVEEHGRTLEDVYFDVMGRRPSSDGAVSADIATSDLGGPMAPTGAA